MRLTISRPALHRALTAVSSAVDKRNTIPILSHVKLTATGGSLVIEGTNLDISVRMTAPAHVESDGSCTALADLFKAVVGRLPEAAHVELELRNGTLHLSAGRTSLKLPTLEVEDFPALASDQFETTFELPASDLAGALARTGFAASTEETRYYLAGVYMHDANGQLAFVATDGNRLALHKLSKTTPDGMSGVIIPTKTVALLSKLCNEEEGSVRVSTSATKLRVAGSDFTVLSKVVDGTFPDYARVIPHVSNVLECDSLELKAALDRVTLVSDDVKCRGVHLKLSEDQLELSVNSATLGEARDELPAAWAHGKLELGLNSKLLASIINAVKSENVRMSIKSAADPVRIDDGNSMFVLMPMRI